MELLNYINKIRYKNEDDLMPTIYASGFAYNPPRTEHVIFEMGTPDLRSFNIGKKSAFVGSIYPAIGDVLSAVKEDKLRVITINNTYIVEKMDILNDNEDARCYTFIAKNIIERKK